MGVQKPDKTGSPAGAFEHGNCLHMQNRIFVVSHFDF